MTRVYLAGKMQGRLGADVLQERAHAVDLCEANDLIPVDPAATELIYASDIVDMNMSWRQMQAFVSKDEFAIKTCDVLLILTGDTPSEGTGLEFGLALSLGIPVIVVSPLRAAGQKMGFWDIKASATFGTIDEAVEFIADNFSTEA